MDSCFKTSDNKHSQCPPRMSDGRHFTDYRNQIDDLIRADNNINNSLQYRIFLQENANALMDKNRDIACKLNCCGPCPITQSSKEPFDVGTMLPEKYKFVTDGRTGKYVENNINGLGVGRQYYNYPNQEQNCENLPNSWPTTQATNNCIPNLDKFAYQGTLNPTPTSLRQRIPGGGNIANV